MSQISTEFMYRHWTPTVIKFDLLWISVLMAIIAILLIPASH